MAAGQLDILVCELRSFNACHVHLSFGSCAPDKPETLHDCRCPVCRSHVCWRCAGLMPANDPYSHYKQLGPCYNKAYARVHRHS